MFEHTTKMNNSILKHDRHVRLFLMAVVLHAVCCIASSQERTILADSAQEAIRQAANTADTFSSAHEHAEAAPLIPHNPPLPSSTNNNHQEILDISSGNEQTKDGQIYFPKTRTVNQQKSYLAFLDADEPETVEELASLEVQKYPDYVLGEDTDRQSFVSAPVTDNTEVDTLDDIFDGENEPPPELRPDEDVLDLSGSTTLVRSSLNNNLDPRYVSEENVWLQTSADTPVGGFAHQPELEDHFFEGFGRYTDEDNRVMRDFRQHQDVEDFAARDALFSQYLLAAKYKNTKDKRAIVALNRFAIPKDKRFLRGFNRYHKRFLYGPEKYDKRFMRGLVKRDDSVARMDYKRFIVGLSGYSRRGSDGFINTSDVTGNGSDNRKYPFSKEATTNIHVNPGTPVSGLEFTSKELSLHGASEARLVPSVTMLNKELTNTKIGSATERADFVSQVLGFSGKNNSSSGAEDFNKRFIKGLTRRSDISSNNYDKRFMRGLIKKSDDNEDKRFMRGLIKKSDDNEDKRFMRGLVKKSDVNEDKRFMRGLAKKSDESEDKRFIKGLVKKADDNDDKRFMRGLIKKSDSNEDKRFMRGLVKKYDEPLTEPLYFLTSKSITYKPSNSSEENKLASTEMMTSQPADEDYTEEDDLLALSNKRFMRGLYAKKNNNAEESKRFVNGFHNYAKRDNEITDDEINNNDKRFMRGFSKKSLGDKAFSMYPVADESEEKINKVVEDLKNFVKMIMSEDDFKLLETTSFNRFIKGLVKQDISDDNFEDKRFMRGLVKKEDVDGSNPEDKRFMRGLVKKEDIDVSPPEDKRFMRGLFKKDNIDASYPGDKRFMRGLVKKEDIDVSPPEDKRFMRGLVKKEDIHVSPPEDKRFMRGLVKKEDIDVSHPEDKRFMRGLVKKEDIDVSHPKDKRFMRGLVKKEVIDVSPPEDKRFMRGLIKKEDIDVSHPEDKRFMRGLVKKEDIDVSHPEDKRFMRGLVKKEVIDV